MKKMFFVVMLLVITRYTFAQEFKVFSNLTLIAKDAEKIDLNLEYNNAAALYAQNTNWTFNVYDDQGPILGMTVTGFSLENFLSSNDLSVPGSTLVRIGTKSLPVGAYKAFLFIPSIDITVLPHLVSDTFYFEIEQIVGVDDQIVINKKNFYPNPVVANQIFFAPTDAELYDVQGRLVQKIQAGANTIHAVPGMYLVKNTAGNVSRLAVK